MRYKVVYDGIFSGIDPTQDDDPDGVPFSTAKCMLLTWARRKRDEWGEVTARVRKMQEADIE